MFSSSPFPPTYHLQYENSTHQLSLSGNELFPILYTKASQIFAMVCIRILNLNSFWISNFKMSKLSPDELLILNTNL